MGSDNPVGADNQQERPIAGLIGILRGHTPDIRLCRMMRWSHLHGDMQERRDVHKDVLIPRFGKDGPGAELLRSQFQEPSSIPVLIQEKLRLNEVAERSSGMPLKRHAHAAFTFNEAG